jgi:hypothetical protein
LRAQTVSRSSFEVIVADDGSCPPVAPGLEREDGWLTVVDGPPITSYAARNRAASVARGRVLAFCDSDCRPLPDWLEHGLTASETSEIVAGEVTYVAPERPSVWSLLTVDLYLHQRHAVQCGVAATANMFVAQATFARVGGFDESLPSGGDWDFVRRATDAGARLAYTSRAVVAHPTLHTAPALLRKTWRVNRWGETRRARAGMPMSERRGSLVAGLVPLYGMARDRRRTHRPVIALDAARLAEAGMAAPRRQRILGIAAAYLVVAPTIRLAQLHGRATHRLASAMRARSSAPAD